MSDTSGSIHDLETPTHERERRIEAICERTGWGVIAVILIAALLGLLGPGPLSHRTRAAPDGSLSVEYGLIERYEAPAELRISVDPARVENGMARLAVSRSLADEITPESMSPRPASIESVGDRVVYSFQMSALESQDAKVVTRFRNDRFGVLEYDVGLEGHRPLHITQFILP